jgi:hypothetical protein
MIITIIGLAVIAAICVYIKLSTEHHPGGG